MTARFSFKFSSEDEKAIKSPVKVPDPPQTKLPEISTLSLISIVPPAESIIKLPVKDYKESLKNFLSIKNQDKFKKYKIFDYRIKDQLILK